MGPAASPRARRRLLRGGLALAGSCLLAGCGSAPPWMPGLRRPPTLGFLAIRSSASPELSAFTDALRSLGYVVGRTIRLEYRWGGPDSLAADLVRLIEDGLDIMVTISDATTRIAKEASGTIPIVMLANGDPVKAGLVASLARPGGNVTGLTSLTPELDAKRLELLKAAIPGLRRVGLLWHADYLEGSDPAELQTAARSLGLEPVPMRLRIEAYSRDMQAVADAVDSGQIEALVVAYEPVGLIRYLLASLARQHRLPTICRAGTWPSRVA